MYAARLGMFLQRFGTKQLIVKSVNSFSNRFVFGPFRIVFSTNINYSDLLQDVIGTQISWMLLRWIILPFPSLYVIAFSIIDLSCYLGKINPGIMWFNKSLNHYLILPIFSWGLKLNKTDKHQLCWFLTTYPFKCLNVY